ncbi:hypothetical protein BACPEC_01482 [[Bacteroides] pectinophilus ATCC 43243]|uniref:Uncharacterized protein n=1 Tax=[Bacteroides] pectinophilus ATCC 43243 TaxID=483218 RepID=B7ATL0_9FIRM|nr:hypothetical protein BACPEC_01482 [[Bacteroides] pectinophilus ATCC 43243]
MVCRRLFARYFLYVTMCGFIICDDAMLICDDAMPDGGYSYGKHGR